MEPEALIIVYGTDQLPAVYRVTSDEAIYLARLEEAYGALDRAPTCQQPRIREILRLGRKLIAMSVLQSSH